MELTQDILNTESCKSHPCMEKTQVRKRLSDSYMHTKAELKRALKTIELRAPLAIKGKAQRRKVQLLNAKARPGPQVSQCLISVVSQNMSCKGWSRSLRAGVSSSLLGSPFLFIFHSSNLSPKHKPNDAITARLTLFITVTLPRMWTVLFSLQTAVPVNSPSQR